MLKKLSVAIACVIAAIASLAIASEDAVKADPEHYTVEFENDRVRIIRIKYGAGEKSVMHTHGPHVAITLTENMSRMTLPDGSVQEAMTVPGAAEYTDANEHLPENLSDSELEVVLIELKD